MPLRDGFFSTATQTSCCNRIQRSNRVRLLVVSTHDFPDNMLPWYSAPTVMHSIFWMVTSHSGLVHATVVLIPHGNARYFLDGNRPLFWYILLRYSATTVMYGIFYIFWGYSRVRVVLRCQYVRRTRKSPDLELKYEILYSGEHNKRQCPDHNKRQTFSANNCEYKFSSHLFWTSNPLEVPAGATQDFSSTFLLRRCVPLFLSREGFSSSFPSSTVKSN